MTLLVKPTHLDIGCGLNPKKPLDLWTHLDLNEGPHIEIVCDFGKIPVEDDSLEQIWLGDVIEHVPQWRRREVFSEWWRILKPGGLITGSTPNLLSVARRYVEGGLNIEEALVPNLYGWTDRPTEQHYITYTPETLTAEMQFYGFEIQDYSQSPGPATCPWWLVFQGRKVDY